MTSARATRRCLLLPAAAMVAPLARAPYDPPPLDEIARAQGVWQGTLTDRDHSPPHRRVVRPTRPA